MSSFNIDIAALVSKLTLEEKVSLLTGRDFWNTVPLESIGLRNLLLSDGPSGVRGEFWDERDVSLNLPSATSLGSSWSVRLAKEYGEVLAHEAKRKGVDVVLGPTINLHRSPLGGRHFEAFSEDAVLTGALAANYIVGMQAQGIGACPKHYVANDFETERYTVNVKVDDRTLNELYLRPFEDAVIAGKAWTIMSSYNSLNGPTVTENEILNNPLRTQWGFDGVVISDWTAVRSLNSAKYEQDLAMPGPMGPWGEALVAAVKAGEIEESTINRKIVRILTLAARVGALTADGKTPAAVVRGNKVDQKDVAFARRAASEGSVLLKNEGILPLNAESLKSVALIGHNANAARTQGGGSATVHPESVVTPLQALSELFGSRLTYSFGAVVQDGIAELPRHTLHNPISNTPGVHVQFFDETGKQIFADNRLISNLIWIGADVPLFITHSAKFTAVYTPDESGVFNLGFASQQASVIKVDGEVVLDVTPPPHEGDPFSGLMDPPFFSTPFNFEVGKSVTIEVEVNMTGRTGLGAIAFGYNFGFEPDKTNPQAQIDAAAENAKNSELAIVVVGTNSKVESEGYDRKSLALPGLQDQLVEAVANANPNTIVIVNSGSPVLMPWRDKVKAILVTYFAGQEMGNALVDLLTGASEPGGRLPTTWPAVEDNIPVLNVTPHNSELTYTEGIHIGYRAWLKSNAEAAYNFGFGLGYTDWKINSFTTPSTFSSNQDFEVSFELSNTGGRSGKTVVQVYAERANTSIDRPVRWLVGFAEVIAAAGATLPVSIPVRAREFAHWDNGWKYESGEFTLRVGFNVMELPHSQNISLQ